MTRKIRIRSIITLLTLVIISYSAGCTQSPADSDALYIYMCGSNLETKDGAATKNIAEILSATLPKGTTIIIETGGSKKWRNYDISSEKLSRYKVEGDKLVLLETQNDASMGDPATLTSFLKFCKDKYPAKNTGVILWDHGNGFKGICNDENHGFDALTLTELDKAFSDVGNKYGFIGFDACLMANFETAKVMSKYADHMVASEEIEPSGGWDYKAVITAFGKDSFYSDILTSYEEKCNKGKKTGFTLSSIDLTGFEKVAESFSSFCGKELWDNAGKALQTVDKHAQNTICFGANSSSEGRSNLIDLSGFAKENGNSDLPKAIADAVTCVNGADRSGACGLSFFYPFADKEYVKDYLGWAGEGSYKKYLNSYYMGASTDEDKIVFANTGKAVGGELYFELTPESLQYVKYANYKLYRMVPLGDDFGEEAQCLGLDTDVIPEGNGGFTTSFEGKWVKMNGMYVPCEAVDKDGDITIYTTTVKCNGEEGNIRFSFDYGSRVFHVLGFVPKGEDKSQGRLFDINDGDKIVIMQEVLDENYETSLKETGEFTVDKEIAMEVDTLPEGFYQFSVYVTDLYGKEYRSATMVSEFKAGKLEPVVVTEDVDQL